MAENKSNTGLWIAGGFLVLAGGALLYFKNKAKKDAQQQDSISEDIDDYETQQALKLKGLLGVSKGVMGWTTNGEIGTYFNAQTHVKILNEMLAVVDWSDLQKKFRALCNGEYTLANALNSALTDNDYKKAIEYAAAKKAVTNQTYRTGNKTFPANTILGAIVGEGMNLIGNKTYKVINEVTSADGYHDTEVIVDVPQDMVNVE